jgi:hypothetical protein
VTERKITLNFSPSDGVSTDLHCKKLGAGEMPAAYKWQGRAHGRQWRGMIGLKDQML